jgi:hypothetical protein
MIIVSSGIIGGRTHHRKALTSVLSRLRASRRGLIGPTVFPVYVLALKAGLAITLTFTVVAAALGVTMADHVGSSVGATVIAFTRRALLPLVPSLSARSISSGRSGRPNAPSLASPFISDPS